MNFAAISHGVTDCVHISLSPSKIYSTKSTDEEKKDVICLLFNAGGQVEFREDLGSLSILKAY